MTEGTRMAYVRHFNGPRRIEGAYSVRAATALAAFTTQSNGGWIMLGKHPS